MMAEHGDLKDLECTGHETCRARESRSLYNAFTLYLYINHVKVKSDVKVKGKQ